MAGQTEPTIGIGPGYTNPDARRVGDAYGLALAALLGSVLLMIAAGSPIVSPVALTASVLQLAALGLTLRVSGIAPRSFHLGMTVLVVISAAMVASAIMGGMAGRAVALAGWILIAFTTMGAIGNRLRTYRVVNGQLVLGLLCIYLLLGLLFGLSYSLLDAINGPALTGSAIEMNASAGISNTMYYSFITLATVGYGDITPLHPIARALAVAESMFGQLYLVSIVSFAVSRLGRNRREAPASEE